MEPTKVSRRFILKGTAATGALAAMPAGIATTTTLPVAKVGAAAVTSSIPWQRLKILASQLGYLSDPGLCTELKRWPDYYQSLKQVSPKMVGYLFEHLTGKIKSELSINEHFNTSSPMAVFRLIFNNLESTKPDVTTAELLNALRNFASSQDPEQRRQAKALIRMLDDKMPGTTVEEKLNASAKNFIDANLKKLNRAYKKLLAEYIESGQLKSDPRTPQHLIIPADATITYKQNTYATYDYCPEKTSLPTAHIAACRAGKEAKWYPTPLGESYIHFQNFSPVRFDISIPRRTDETNAAYTVRTHAAAKEIAANLPEEFIEKITVSGAGNIHLMPNYKAVSLSTLAQEIEGALEVFVKELKNMASPIKTAQNQRAR